jgi:formate transporter
MATHGSVDAYTPREIAAKWERLGVEKAAQPFHRAFTLAIMAGAFVGMGSMFYQIVLSDWKGSYGLGQVLGGFAFLLGLAAIILAGGELFTGNTMQTIAVAQGKLRFGQMLKSWAIVLGGNILGAVLMALLAYWTGHWQAAGNLVGAKALSIGAAKSSISLEMAFARGILCNLYVCLAVWAYNGGRTVVDKLAAMTLPIMAFVASGTEHIIANWFYGPYALMVKQVPAVAALVDPAKLEHLTLGAFVLRQVFVLLGNIIGGGLFFAGAYWFAFLKGEQKAAAAQDQVA